MILGGAFSFCIFFFFFFCSFFFLSFSTVSPLGHLARANYPRGRGGWPFCVELTRLSGAPAQWSLPFWGPWTLAQILPEEKRHSPERVARNPRKGPAGSSLSGWPQVPSGVPAVLFPFFSRGRSPVLPQSTSGFPLPEKNPKTHGVLASQDSVPQGGSQGRATNKVRDQTGGYRFKHHNSCGTREMRPSARAPSTHCACAK